MASPVLSESIVTFGTVEVGLDTFVVLSMGTVPRGDDAGGAESSERVAEVVLAVAEVVPEFPPGALAITGYSMMTELTQVPLMGSMEQVSENLLNGLSDC